MKLHYCKWHLQSQSFSVFRKENNVYSNHSFLFFFTYRFGDSGLEVLILLLVISRVGDCFTSDGWIEQAWIFPCCCAVL